MNGINCNITLQTKLDTILKNNKNEKICELDISKEKWE